MPVGGGGGPLLTITINYKGLSGIRGTLTVNLTDTLATIVAAIIVDEGLNGDYYADFILDRDNTISFTNNSADTYADLGLDATDTLVAILDDDPGVYNKEQRQLHKLEIAAVKRAYDSKRSISDITQLPNPYNGNDVDPDETPNLGKLTLTPGVIRTGVYKITYSGYHGDNVAFTDTATVTAAEVATNFTIASIAENTTVLYVGYLLANYTGTWTFTLTSDDGAYLWIGANAVSGYTTGNASATSTYNTTGTITSSITAGQYYPIRILFGNGPVTGYLNLTYAYTGQTATNDFTGKLFSPGVQLVEGRPWIE